MALDNKCHRVLHSTNSAEHNSVQILGVGEGHAFLQVSPRTPSEREGLTLTKHEGNVTTHFQMTKNQGMKQW